MNNPGIKDFIIWDTMNWSKAIHFWEKYLTQGEKPLQCLELGSHQGGLSLWLASKGHHVVCSDMQSPKEQASTHHAPFRMDNITYESIDATQIPYKEQFDIIVFKSMLGGASRAGNDKNKAIVLEQIHQALKPSGILLFAENLEATAMHRFLRKRFISWGKDWNYLKYRDVDELFSIYSEVKYSSVGYFGIFGRSEPQRRFLGRIDQAISLLIPKSCKYILIGMARK